LGKHWLEHWHPFIIPLLLAAVRVGTKVRFAEYQWSVLASDLCYLGVSFYIWALTALQSNIPVCPPNRALAGGAEKTYILFFLIANIAGSMLFYPMVKESISDLKLGLWIGLALLFAIGSPLYLRAPEIR
jgi:hypothetical protein